MRKKFLNEKGFTLIEIIASLVILVIVGALVIISTIKIVQGFVFTKMNAETSQKGHIALNRLTKEFTNIEKVTSGNGTSINFTSRNYITGLPIEEPYTPQSVSRTGSELFLNTDTLVDNVSSFVLTYYDYSGGAVAATDSKVIEITLSLVGANGNVSVFTTRVAPRNL
jgi:prepilin-type N-terminal cleavage/methylation domain-containing protein